MSWVRLPAQLSGHHYLFAVVSGIFVGIAYPGINLAVFAWIALIPLLLALRDQAGFPSFKLGLVSGTVMGLIICHYLFLSGYRYIGRTTPMILAAYLVMSLTARPEVRLMTR